MDYTLLDLPDSGMGVESAAHFSAIGKQSVEADAVLIFQAEGRIRDLRKSPWLGNVVKRQDFFWFPNANKII